MKLQSNGMTPRRMHRRLVIEELERRVAPAGNVTAVVTGGNLIITGDDAANNIVIDQLLLNADELRITSGGDPTTINGAVGPETFSGITKAVKIKLGDGADRLTIQDALLPQNLLVNLGHDANTLLVQNTNFLGSVAITGGPEADFVTFNLTAYNTPTAKPAKILLGNGDNTLFMNLSDTIGLLAKCGAGADTVLLTDIFALQDVKLVLGSGANNTSLVNTLNGLSIGRHLLINGGDGQDNLTLTKQDVGGNVKINLGDGNNTTVVSDFGNLASVKPNLFQIKGANGIDSVTMTDFDTDGMKICLGGGDNILRMNVNSGVANSVCDFLFRPPALVITAGAGADDVRIEDTEIHGAKISLGGGDNVLRMLPVAWGPGIPVYWFTIQVGDGNDLVHLEGFDNSLGEKSSVIKTGAGDDTVTIADGSISDLSFLVSTGSGCDTVDIREGTLIRGKVAIQTGADADTFFLDDVTQFNGKITISTGAGNDWIAVERFDSLTLRSTFNGEFVLKAGSDDDDIRVGIDGLNVGSADFHGLCIIDGGAGSLDRLDMGIKLLTLNGNTFAVGYTIPGIEDIAT